MRIVIISGGSSGIGEACVHKFHDQGDYVFNLDIKENNALNSLKNYQWLATDVTQKVDMIKSVSEVITQKNKIDVLLISAGKHLSANIENTSDTHLMDLLNLNLLGAYWLIQNVIPYMKQQQYGNIITIGSDQSIIAKPNSTAYGMTKAALAHLTKSVALDYATFNIRANCIGAGTIDTPLYRAAIARYATHAGIALADVEQAEALEQPMGRIGRAEEIAELAYFLATDKCAYLTGALIPFDGGYTIR